MAPYYHGLYQSKAAKGGSTPYRSFLRFYPDRIVMEVSSTGTAEEVSRFLVKERAQDSSIGLYSLEKGDLRFACVSLVGVVEYEGAILGDRLVLHSQSHINGRRATEEYQFVAVESLSIVED